MTIIIVLPLYRQLTFNEINRTESAKNTERSKDLQLVALHSFIYKVLRFVN